MYTLYKHNVEMLRTLGWSTIIAVVSSWAALLTTAVSIVAVVSLVVCSRRPFWLAVLVVLKVIGSLGCCFR
jgi:hypothetical protein